LVVSQTAQADAQRAGEIVMASSFEAGDYTLEMLGDNFCKVYAHTTMGTALGTAIEQNQLCVTPTCETLQQVAIMSVYKSCKVCYREKTRNATVICRT
jgi:hypothetical protein